MRDMRPTYCFGSAVVKRVLYNDTETLMVRLQSHLLGSYVTNDLHTARINNDERVLYNGTETLMGRLPSHLLGPYVTHVPHTSRSAMMKEYCIDGFHSGVIKL